MSSFSCYISESNQLTAELIKHIRLAAISLSAYNFAEPLLGEPQNLI